jgi:TorA maturation chaperone TorD
MTARADLFRALGALAEPPEPGHAAIAAALGLPGSPAAGDYADAFLLGAYPYASVWLGADGMLGGEARDRVAGFWRALGLVPPAEPDHLAALLGLYAGLVDAETDGTAGDPAAAALRHESRRALLWEHLASWLPPYCAVVADLAAPYYAGWAALVRAALADEAAGLGGPSALPLHLRSAPGLPAPDAPARDWVAALLAAVRSGLFVTRPGIVQAARRIGVGVRMGERAFMLRSMLEQDAAGTVGWLADEAERWAARHAGDEPSFGPLADFWRSRAEATREALRSLDPRGAVPPARC